MMAMLRTSFRRTPALLIRTSEWGRGRLVYAKTGAGTRHGSGGAGRGPLLQQHLAQAVLEEIELADANPGEQLLDVAVLQHVAPHRASGSRLDGQVRLVDDAEAVRALGIGLRPRMEVGEHQPARLQHAGDLGGHPPARLRIVVVEKVPGD